MSHSRDERSPSPNDSASPGNSRHRHRPNDSASPRDRRQRPNDSVSPGDRRHRPHDTASPGDRRHWPHDMSSPGDRRHRSRSRSRSRSPPRAPRRSRSRSPEEAFNPGNNLYVTGLSTRVTTSDLEKFFSKEGKVVQCSLVTDPHTKESRGFGFVTMESAEDAERCIKYLNRSVFEGRLITVEKAKRSRGRTPTPGRYQGQREKRGGRGRRRSFSPRRRYDRGHYDRDHYPRDRRGTGRSRSPYRRRVDDYSDSYRRA